jgi:hypothetical protein
MSSVTRERVRAEAIASAQALEREKARIASLTEDELFAEQRNEICKITEAPARTKALTTMQYLEKFKLFSEGAAALGAGLTLGGPTALVGAPIAAAGVSSAVLASAAKYIIKLYSASTVFKRQLRPILNLLCEFPPNKMRPAFEILFALQKKLEIETDVEEQQSLIETAKLNLVVELVEAALAQKAAVKSIQVEMGGATGTRGRRYARHRGYTASKHAGTKRVRHGVGRRRRTTLASLGRRG